MEPPPREPSPPGTSPPEHDLSPPSPSQSSSSPLGTRRSSPRSPSLSFFFSVLFSNLRSHYKLCAPRGRPLRSSLLSFTDARDRFLLRQTTRRFLLWATALFGPALFGISKRPFQQETGNLPCASQSSEINIFFFSSVFSVRDETGAEIDFTQLCSPNPKKESRFPFLTP